MHDFFVVNGKRFCFILRTEGRRKLAEKVLAMIDYCLNESNLFFFNKRVKIARQFLYKGTRKNIPEALLGKRISVSVFPKIKIKWYR